MKKLKCILAVLSSVFILTGCATTFSKNCYNDCYTTKVIDVAEFVKDKGDDKEIVPVEINCKDGYFMTGIKMQPELFPKEYGQYIIVSTIVCCGCIDQ